jgi:L-xylulokinase
MGRYLLGVDAGSTVTKAVLFDETGGEIGQAAQRVPHSYPHPHHAERDQDELWEVTCSVIREVIDTTGIRAEDIAGVAVTSHGDGIYLVDERGRPTRPGILSLDTRAAELVAGWERTGQSDTGLLLSGQRPWPGSPVSVLAWLMRNEPDVMARTAYALPGKDVIKQRLTNVFSTDPTESSLSFTNVYSQEYDLETLRAFEVDELFHLLPQVIPSGEVAGEVTDAAAERCGLAPGTPVASGAHDVDCGAIGMGTVLPGQLAIIAGTFSINEIISDVARVDERWNARNFVVPGQWMNMSISPSSATNLEWFATKLATRDVKAGGAEGGPFAFVEEDLRTIESSPSDLIYLPFLYGSPYPVDASAAFVGLRGWHERGHMLRAVMEGVVFNHRHHVDALRDGFDVTDIRLTGGAVNSARWVQMFADTLATPVGVSNVREAGALGSAMLAGIAVGVYSDLPDAAAAIATEPVVCEPTPGGVARQEENYRRYQRVVEAMTAVWAGLEGAR